MSVAIPALNEEAHIGKVLDAFSQSKYPNIVEIVVADGRSGDRTRELIDERAKKDARIRWIDNPNKLQAPGLNLILEQAQGDVFLRADAHAEYAADYIECCVEAMQETGALNVGGAQRYKWETSFQAAVACVMDSFLGTGGAAYKNPNRSGFVDTVWLGCFARQAIRSLGGYDEAMAANEDAELNIRISKLKKDAVYLSDKIVAYYHPRKNLLDLFKQYYKYGTYRALNIKKHPHALTPRQWLPVLVIPFLIGIIILFILNNYWIPTTFFGIYFLWCMMLPFRSKLRLAKLSFWASLITIPVGLLLGYAFGFLNTFLLRKQI